MVMKNI